MGMERFKVHFVKEKKLIDSFIWGSTMEYTVLPQENNVMHTSRKGEYP